MLKSLSNPRFPSMSLSIAAASFACSPFAAEFAESPLSGSGAQRLYHLNCAEARLATFFLWANRRP